MLWPRQHHALLLLWMVVLTFADSVELLTVSEATPIQTARKKLQGDYDAASTSRERDEKVKVKVKAALEKVQDNKAHEQKVASEAAAAVEASAKKTKEVQVKAKKSVGGNAPGKTALPSKPQEGKVGLRAEVATDALEQELSAQTARSMQAVKAAQDDVSKKTKTLVDLKKRFAMEKVIKADKGAQKKMVMTEVRRQGEAEAKRDQKLKAVAMRDQMREVTEGKEEQRQEQLQSQQKALTGVIESQVQLATQLKAKQTKLQQLQAKLKARMADVEGQQHAKANSVPANAKQASKGSNVLQMQKDLMKAMLSKQEKLTAASKLHDKQLVVLKTVATTVSNQIMTLKQKATALQNKRLHFEKDVSEKKQKLVVMRSVAQKQQADAAAAVNAQHLGFVAFKKYKEKEETVKHLHRSRIAAKKRLKELGQKRVARAEAAKRAKVIKTATKFSKFLHADRAKRIARLMKKKQELDEHKQNKILQKTYSTNLLHMARRMGRGKGKRRGKGSGMARFMTGSGRGSGVSLLQLRRARRLLIKFENK